MDELASLKDRIAALEESLKLIDGRLKAVFQGPIHTYFPPIQVVSPGVYVEPAAQTEQVCHEDITTTQTGTAVKETATADLDPFGPGDQADADSNARTNLKAYGEQWCSKGSCAASAPKTCKPKLSEIKNQGYVSSSAPKAADPNKKVWTLTATISGKVSCTCQD